MKQCRQRKCDRRRQEMLQRTTSLRNPCIFDWRRPGVDHFLIDLVGDISIMNGDVVCDVASDR
ncbi:hypothetical protein HanRHA438_Chr10g0468301 [Helianthus annuus]|nr:hypothetical protein HanRHA438_Chr10g0468301 [Helianthus annuus]